MKYNHPLSPMRGKRAQFLFIYFCFRHFPVPLNLVASIDHPISPLDQRNDSFFFPIPACRLFKRCIHSLYTTSTWACSMFRHHTYTVLATYVPGDLFPPATPPTITAQIHTGIHASTCTLAHTYSTDIDGVSSAPAIAGLDVWCQRRLTLMSSVEG